MSLRSSARDFGRSNGAAISYYYRVDYWTSGTGRRDDRGAGAGCSCRCAAAARDFGRSNDGRHQLLLPRRLLVQRDRLTRRSRRRSRLLMSLRSSSPRLRAQQ